MNSELARAPTLLPDVLFVDTNTTATRYVPQLQNHYQVTTAWTSAAAIDALDRIKPALVVTELDLSDGPGEAVCRRAKSLSVPATVLVTTAVAERAPSAIASGCDGVLLKPFPPNLLFARIGRLLRARSTAARRRAHLQSAKSSHLREQVDRLVARTNREWPSTHCPYCSHPGVTSFEHSSHRRDWFACLSCEKVWLARRRDE
jgi:DNA-binding response OmpR family regulator